jgi:hypothetical protein
MIKKILEKLFNYIERNFFQSFFYRKLCLIGHSHLLSYRNNYKNIKELNNLDFKIFSQNGEDGIIDFLLYNLQIDSPKFIEIGVGDYNESNTRFIFETRNSKGLIIDCMDNFEQKVKKNINTWKGDIEILQEFVDDTNIIEILKRLNFLHNIDLFSLDVDGIDYWIVKKLPSRFSKIAILEFNSNFGPEIEVTVPNIPKFNRTEYHYSNLCFGASLKALINLMKSKGFSFIGTNRTFINAFFVVKEEVRKLNLNLPDEKNLQKFTDSCVRESRSANGELSYLSGVNKLKSIRECEVIDLSNNNYKKIKIKNIKNITNNL